MISMHASAVCHVRDGYTGRELQPSALICAIDGAPCRPVGKEGGYLVFLNLPHGAHRLSLRCQGYQEEWVEFEADGGTREIDVTMKPGPGYPFRQTVTRLTLTVLEKNAPASGRVLWLAAAGPELKIAQTKVEAGETETRIFCKQTAPPGAYFLEDGKDSEIVILRGIEGEQAVLAAPLKNSHSRSKQFLPAQRYRTGEDGTLTAVFREPCTVQVYAEGAGPAGSVALNEGENRSTIKI